jgi:ArsR family transcriptional regulator
MDLIQIYQCLCDRTRVRLLHLLAQTPLCVCHFQEILQEPQVKISKHLAYLRDRKMVTTDRDQNWIIYSLPTRQPATLRKNLKCLQDCARSEKVFAQDLQRLHRLKQTCCEPRRLFRAPDLATRNGKAKRSLYLRS